MDIKFICEVGSNHNQDMPRAIKLIKKAKEIGCWAVKFQYFKANKLYAPEFKNKINQMKKWELPESFLPEIEAYCNDLDIKFICSVFDVKSVAFVKDYVDFLKIGSYELLYHDLIGIVAQTGKPWMISAGMINILDLAFELSVKINLNIPKIIFHCNSNYPAKVHDCDLDQIELFRLNYNQNLIDKVGWSDHTVEPGVIYKAIALGAEIIEFHMDLEDGKGFEYPIGHCWLPHQIKEVIQNVQIGEEACQPVSSDKDNEIRKWRMDPEDGMRPLKKYRGELLKNS